MEYYKCNTKEQTVNIRYNLDDSQRHLLSEKKPISKGYILYDPIYLTVWKETKLWGRRTDRWLQKVMSGERQSSREHRGVF